MPISYSIDEVNGVIHEVWTGDVYANDLAAYWKDYLQDPRVLELRKTLVDMRLALPHFTGTELSDLINSIAVPLMGRLTWKSALLVAHPHQYGVTRQYHVFAEIYSRDAIFHDRDEALSWLMDDKELST